MVKTLKYVLSEWNDLPVIFSSFRFVMFCDVVPL